MMGRFIVCVFLFIPIIATAQQRYLDGFYITGGSFISKLEADFLGSERKISDNRPMVFVGYGKTSRTFGSRGLRMYVGVEGFYMGGGKSKSGSDVVIDRTVDEIVTTEIIERDDGSTRRRTTTREEVTESEVETRYWKLKQKDSLGGGIRVGIVGQNKDKDRTGTLYALLGYAKTEMQGEGRIEDPDNGQAMLIIPEQSLDLSGYYYGVGYEYAFNNRWALRADYLKFKYSDDDFDIEDGNSNERTRLSNPGRIDAEQSGVFMGLTVRF